MSGGFRNRRTYVSNRIDLTFDGFRVGAVQSAECQMSFALEPISGIGSEKVLEYIPTLARVSVNTDMVYIFNHEIERRVQGAGNEIPFMADDSLSGWVFDIVAIHDDASSDPSDRDGTRYTTVWKAMACEFDSGSFRVAKHGAIGRAASFMALDFRLAGNTDAYSPPRFVNS